MYVFVCVIGELRQKNSDLRLQLSHHLCYFLTYGSLWNILATAWEATAPTLGNLSTCS
jgi:hypothetical protein